MEDPETDRTTRSASVACWRCDREIDPSWNCCAACGARLRDTRTSFAVPMEVDVGFADDLYSFSWYNRLVAAIALYDSVASVDHFYVPGVRPEYAQPVEEPLAQRILRTKLYAEFIGLLESYGMLCLAIKNRNRRSILWSYFNTEPQEVDSFFQSALAVDGTPNFQKLLKLPLPATIIRACSVRTDDLAGLQYPGDAYLQHASNLRAVAELYRDAGGRNVTIYNKIKHGFLLIHGGGWMTEIPDPDSANVLIETKDAGTSSRIGFCPLSMTQEAVDRDLSNIRVVTDMGAELLALVKVLARVDLLFQRPAATTLPSQQ